MSNPLLFKQSESLLSSTECFVANAANLSALLFDSIEALNWVGFYFLQGDNLLLGPFKGKPACTVLKKGKGVCQAALEKKETLIVNDVHAFANHIACDCDTNSELVIPLFYEDKAIGVLDIDSPVLDRFSESDREFFESIAKEYMKSINIHKLLEYYWR